MEVRNPLFSDQQQSSDPASSAGSAPSSGPASAATQAKK